MQQIDVYKVIEDKSPKLARRLPKFVVNYLKRIIHQDELNEVLSKYSDLEGIEFVRAALKELGISYHSVGSEDIDPARRYVFASNHPFGGLDGLMLADEVTKRFGEVRIVVNDLLMHIDPLKPLFVPVNKHGRQNEKSVHAFNDAFASDMQIITFPAGLCSRRRKGVVCDLEWKSNFIRKAVQSERDIVPVYFDGKLSGFFYRLANLRKFLGIKVNIEMLYLVHEMFKQRGSDFRIVFGRPVSYGALLEGRNVSEAALFIRGKVYELSPSGKKENGYK